MFNTKDQYFQSKSQRKKEFQRQKQNVRTIRSTTFSNAPKIIIQRKENANFLGM